jgi:hypothetical protein
MCEKFFDEDSKDGTESLLDQFFIRLHLIDAPYGAPIRLTQRKKHLVSRIEHSPISMAGYLVPEIEYSTTSFVTRRTQDH